MLAESRAHVSELERLIEHARGREVVQAREMTELLRANITVSVCGGGGWGSLLWFVFGWVVCVCEVWIWRRRPPGPTPLSCALCEWFHDTSCVLTLF